MKKCAICELNYIDDGLEACLVCRPPFVEKPKRGRAKGSSPKPPKIRKEGAGRIKITEPMIAACYAWAKPYIEGRMHVDDAVAAVVAETGMNNASAKRMVYDSISGLFSGRRYKSVMSEKATAWLLETIRSEYGEARYQAALSAVEQHLDYYEQLPRGNAQRKIRAYVNARKN